MKIVIGLTIVLAIVSGIFVGLNYSIMNKTKMSDETGMTSTGVKTKMLNMNNKGLSVVDKDIYRKTDITQLILSNNSIESLPSEMGGMSKMLILKVDHNKLSGSLFAEISQMPLLTNLDVSHNNMTGVPAEIGKLGKLEYLNYSFNQITAFPNELSYIKNNLKELNIMGNPLSAEEVSKIKAALPSTKVLF